MRRLSPPPPSAELPPRRRAEDVYRRTVILFVLLVVVLTAGWWKNERDSCIRNSGIRNGFNRTVIIQRSFLATARDRNQAIVDNPHSDRLSRSSARKAVADYDALIDAQRPVHVLNCGGLFPDAN